MEAVTKTKIKQPTKTLHGRPMGLVVTSYASCIGYIAAKNAFCELPEGQFP